MGVRLAGDSSALAPRVREIAAAVDPSIRLATVQPLDEVVWSRYAPDRALSAGMVGVVSLGLFLSAAGIFSLMSVSVARRTREIGLRAALGASPGRVLAGIFWRALVLIGSGIVAGNSVIVILLFALSLGGGERRVRRAVTADHVDDDADGWTPGVCRAGEARASHQSHGGTEGSVSSVQPSVRSAGSRPRLKLEEPSVVSREATAGDAGARPPCGDEVARPAMTPPSATC